MKLVPESLNEMNFQRGGNNPTRIKKNMGIGSEKQINRNILKSWAKDHGYEFIEDKKGTWRINIPINPYGVAHTYSSSSYSLKAANAKMGDFWRVSKLQYTINYPKGWEDSETPMSLRKRLLSKDELHKDQNLIGRFGDIDELIKRIEKNIQTEQKKGEVPPIN